MVSAGQLVGTNLGGQWFQRAAGGVGRHRSEPTEERSDDDFSTLYAGVRRRRRKEHTAVRWDARSGELRK